MQDKVIFDLIEQEAKRQEKMIQLIASENFVSEEVRSAQGSILTNKYAEGYPGKRYYGGCEIIDQIELLAQERCKKMFETDYHANVQPHSGSQANQAVFLTLLEPGDKILGMDLEHGGHLTHGHKLSLTGKLFEISTYQTDDTGAIDYQEVEKIALREKPKLIICGASAYSLEIDFQKFADIAKKAGAYLLADVAHISGLIVAKEHMSPFGYADFVTSTTHKTLRGPRGGIVLCKPEYAKKLDTALFPGVQGGPLEHVIAAKAVAFNEALTTEFVSYQQQIKKNAQAFCNEFIKLGYEIISGRTENHLFMINTVKSINMTGYDVEELLEKNNIIVNKNTIPGDTNSPRVTSGIRVGTPAMTTKGFKEEDFIVLAQRIDKILKAG